MLRARIDASRSRTEMGARERRRITTDCLDPVCDYQLKSIAPPAYYADNFLLPRSTRPRHQTVSNLGVGGKGR